MLDPQEMTNAEINAVSGGQANSITITESATATPTSGSASLSLAPVPLGTFHFSQATDIGLATNSITARQP
jgi:hypothetical protein